MAGVRVDYRRSMIRRSLASSTIYARMGEVGRWLEHVGEGWTTADRPELEQYLDGRPLGARARSTAISHLHSFYRWARREGLTSADPTELVERPRLPRRLPRPVRRHDVELAIAGADYPTRIALVLMVDAGLRCLEVAGLDWEDVDLHGRRLFVRCGKGGADRVVGIPDRLAVELAACPTSSGPVFGRHVTAARLSQTVNGWLHRHGYGWTCHQLRHTYATRVLEASGNNVAAVQQALGHASISTSEIYARVSPELALDAARHLG